MISKILTRESGHSESFKAVLQLVLSMDTTIHPEGSGHSDPRSVIVFIIIKENYLLVFGNDLKDPDSRVWTHRIIQSSLQLVLSMDTMIHPEGSGHSDPRSVCYKTLTKTLNSMSSA